MSRIRNAVSSNRTRRLKRTGWYGIAIGVLTLLICELPIVLTVIGLSGLGSVASGYRLPPLIEQFAIGIAIASAMAMVISTVIRYLRKRESH